VIRCNQAVGRFPDSIFCLPVSCEVDTVVTVTDEGRVAPSAIVSDIQAMWLKR